MNRYNESTTILTEECDEMIDDATKLNVGDVVIELGDTVVVTEVVNSEIFRHRVVEARDPRTVGAEGGHNAKLSPVRRIRRAVAKDDAGETIGGNGVRVVFAKTCWGKPAKYVREGEDVYCDVCGKAESAVCHTHDYVYVGDGRLYGEDWDTGERRELTPEEAFTWFEDGDVLGLDDVSAEA